MSSTLLVLFGGIVVLGMWFLHRQLAAIHELVNSNLTKVTSELHIADARIRQLERHIADEPDH